MYTASSPERAAPGRHLALTLRLLLVPARSRALVPCGAFSSAFQLPALPSCLRTRRAERQHHGRSSYAPTPIVCSRQAIYSTARRWRERGRECLHWASWLGASGPIERDVECGGGPFRRRRSTSVRRRRRSLDRRHSIAPWEEPDLAYICIFVVSDATCISSPTIRDRWPVPGGVDQTARDVASSIPVMRVDVRRCNRRS